VIIRRKFSVRAFSADLVKYECRALQYIGELCRYLCNAPANPDDDKVRIDYAIGNGMRPDVWEKFQVGTLLSHMWWLSLIVHAAGVVRSSHAVSLVVAHVRRGWYSCLNCHGMRGGPWGFYFGNVQ
jgi:hypothetical protein